MSAPQPGGQQKPPPSPGAATFEADTAPKITLPTGGGAVRGLGEKFGTNPVNGTGTMTVPLVLSSGRPGGTPALALGYDSGHGNGIFGFGWSLDLPTITRRTDLGLPRYDDDEESDIFVLAGSEDLVVLRDDAGRVIRAERDGYEVRYYRPRVEGLFHRIERWTNLSDLSDTQWRTLSGENVLNVFGDDPTTRIQDPHHPERIFAWLLSQVRDDRGNAIVYDYRADDGAGVPVAALHERNRGAAADPARATNRYPVSVRYGNRRPLLDADGRRPGRLSRTDLDAAEWLFQVVFDYGDHDLESPRSHPDREWPHRPDAFSTYRATFEVRTTRLCRRVLMFHHFPDEPGVGRDCLVRTVELDYQSGADELCAPYAMLVSVTRRAYRRTADGGYDTAAIPTLELSYSRAEIDGRPRTISPTELGSAISVDERSYRFLDLHGDGSPGIVSEQAGAWFYQRNLSPARAGDAAFTPAEAVPGRPNTRIADVQFLDLDGDLVPDAAISTGIAAGWYAHGAGDSWLPWRPLPDAPRLPTPQPDLRMVDLDGDGKPDLMITDDDAIIWYPFLGPDGYAAARRVVHRTDEDRGPRLVFDDGTESVHLADMSGDGLSDLVRIRNGDVSYWPNLGFGRFGAKISMDASPVLDTEDQFDQRRVRLGDVDGSGTADLIYLDARGARVYFNDSGNAWRGPQRITGLPVVDALANVAVLDVLGTGTACLVWSSSLPGDQGRNMRYVPLLAEGKPHLLTGIVNNLGAETRIDYAPSTRFAVADRNAGRPWLTKLPYVVHVVESVSATDHIAQVHTTTSYAYHHGHYDGVDREFRGFAYVEQWHAERLNASTLDRGIRVPPAYERAWYHTGAFLGRDRISRGLAHEYFAGDTDDPAQRLLPDTVLPAGLDPDEEREACRALKGSLLRREVYGLDGSGREGIPYRVEEQNLSVRCLQRRGAGRHGVFFTMPRENITFHHERTLADPRIAHTVILDVDDWGNVTRRAAVGYGRRRPPGRLGEFDRQAQGRLLASITDATVTNDVDEPCDFRVPRPAETTSYELTGLHPADGHRFEFAEWSALGHAEHIPYARAASVDRLQLRVVDRVRVRYRPDDLGVAAGDQLQLLPLGRQEARGIPGQKYHLAFTEDVLDAAFTAPAERPSADVLAGAGGYVRDEHGWWVPGGRAFLSTSERPADELAAAHAHFYTAVRVRDPGHGAGAPAETITYYDDYDLFARDVRDPVGNRTTAGARRPDGTLDPAVPGLDYRVLAPVATTDANGNRAQVRFDVLGSVVATAVLGRPDQELGDTLNGQAAELPAQLKAAIFDRADPVDLHRALGGASTRVLYDLFAFVRTGTPPAVCTIARETHMSDLPAGTTTRVQPSFSYTDGRGREVQRKLPAEPDPQSGHRRWTATGWSVHDAMGRPVRRYEPFFTPSHRFEANVRAGVSAQLFYDPLDRLVVTLHPNETYEKTAYGVWENVMWDVNDTVLLDPREDAEVSGYTHDYIERAAEPWCGWYRRRSSGEFGDVELEAALRTATHAGTPTTTWFDALGRHYATVIDNGYRADGSAQRFVNRIELDIEGNQLGARDAHSDSVTPAGRLVQRVMVDLTGRRLREEHQDSGVRVTLPDWLGQPVLAWDSRGHRQRSVYDIAHRPMESWVLGADPERPCAELLVERLVYGEQGAEPDANLRGRVAVQYDQAGRLRNLGYDFTGNLTASERRFAADLRAPLDWADDVGLDEARYESRTRYDALNRVVELVNPSSGDQRPSRQSRGYNEAGLLTGIAVAAPGAATDDADEMVTHVEYDAKGQRLAFVYANGVRTTYTYDPLTFLLTGITTTRRSGRRLQDLRYTYDPIGNVTHVADSAQAPVFFANRRVGADADYRYDPSYRLVQATGREHTTQGSPVPAYVDPTRGHRPLPVDGQALARYTEDYTYDSVGNLRTVRHRSHAPGGTGWARDYHYDTASELDPGQPGNRLSATTVGDVRDEFRYDPHGNLVSGAGLQELIWNSKDQLASSRRLRNRRETTRYVYDAAGQRAAKVTERRGHTHTERRYVGGWEVAIAHGGRNAGAVRETAHVLDHQRRIALLETRIAGSTKGPRVVARIQLSNHLDSATLEIDLKSRLLSYEEYAPFGATTLIGTQRGAYAPKRYRFTGKERDTETGLYYHGARYYLPGLGRWTACDPAGLADGTNAYVYVRNNPIRLADPTGMLSWGQIIGIAAAVVVGTVVTVATAGLAGPLVGAAAAGIIGGIVGGAVGAGVGEAVEAQIDGREAHIGRAMIIGGITGGVFAGAGAAISAGLRSAAGEALASRIASTALGQFATETIESVVNSAAGRAMSRATQAIAQPSERAGIALSQRLGGGVASSAERQLAEGAAARALASQRNSLGNPVTSRTISTATGEETFAHSVGWRGGSHPLGPAANGAQIEAQGALRVTPGGQNGQWGEGAYAFEAAPGSAPPRNGYQFRVPPGTAIERIEQPGSATIVRLVPPPGQDSVPIRITSSGFAPGATQDMANTMRSNNFPLLERQPFGYGPGGPADLGVSGVSGGAGAGAPRIFFGPSEPTDHSSGVPSAGVHF